MAYKDFITHVKKIGIFGGNKFEFVAPLVDGGTNADSTTVSMLCNSAQIPGLNIMTTELRYYGEATERPYGITYGPLQLTFYLDNDLSPKVYFEQWMDEVYIRDKRAMNYYDDYTRDVEVIVYNKAEEEIDRIKFCECYPKNISDIGLSYDSTGAPVVLHVTLVYKWWESSTVSKYEERSNKEESIDSSNTYGYESVEGDVESLGNTTGTTSSGAGGSLTDIKNTTDETDIFSALTNSGTSTSTDSSRYLKTASTLFGSSNLSSNTYENLGDLLSDNASNMFSDMQSIGSSLSSLGSDGVSSGSSVTSNISDLSSSLSSLSSNLGLFNGLSSTLGTGTESQLNTIVSNLSQTSNSINGITSVEKLASPLSSVSSILNEASSVVSQSIPNMVSNSSINIVSQTAFSNVSKSLTSSSTNLSNIVSSIFQ